MLFEMRREGEEFWTHGSEYSPDLTCCGDVPYKTIQSIVQCLRVPVSVLGINKTRKLEYLLELGTVHGNTQNNGCESRNLVCTECTENLNRAWLPPPPPEETNSDTPILGINWKSETVGQSFFLGGGVGNNWSASFKDCKYFNTGASSRVDIFKRCEVCSGARVQQF
jgi:hypothetical protein